MNRFPSIMFAVVLCLAGVVPGFAETPEYTLGEIVVESDKPTAADVATVAEVTAEDIERRGATTLNEALLMLPGVNIRTAADGTPRIDIRGFRTRHIKLLINGVSFQSTYDGQFDPASIPAENIARVVLAKGGSSVLYGAGGTAAVINIITKGGERGMHGSVGARAGETDSYLGKASLSGGNDKGYFFGGVSEMNSNGFPVSGDFDSTTVQDSDLRANSDRQRSSVFFNGAYNLGEGTELGAVLSYTGGSYGKPPSVYPTKDDFAKKPKYERLEDYSEIASQLNLRHEFALPLVVDAALYANQRNELTKVYDDDSYSSTDASGSSKSRSASQIAGMHLQGSYDYDSFGMLTLALNGESQSWDENGYVMETVAGGGGGGGGGGGSKVKQVDFNTRNNLQEYSSSLEYSITPVEPLTLVAGGGYVAQTGPESETATDWIYTLGATYRPIEGTAVHANHARKVRFASVRNLFDTTSGNPDLEPEVARHFEIGLDQELPFKTLFTGAVYRTYAENLIEKDNVTEIYENYEEYLLQGFELGLENTFLDALWVKTSYSYLDSEDQSDDSNRDELQYRPRDTYALEAEYTFPVGFSVYGSAYYVANQFTYNDDATLKERMDDFTVVNLKISQKLLENALSLYAGVNNLFDEDYEESYGFPRPGRTLYCGFDYAF